tara:strand:- start:1611 stop:1892 length:282 start_codon:yes stop_codon:yes gene_type:complete
MIRAEGKKGSGVFVDIMVRSKLMERQRREDRDMMLSTHRLFMYLIASLFHKKPLHKPVHFVYSYPYARSPLLPLPDQVAESVKQEIGKGGRDS